MAAAQDQIDRINENIADTYAVLETMGATMPAARNSDNLAATAASAADALMDGAVLYTPQNKTDDERTQARENIAAASATDLATVAADLAGMPLIQWGTSSIAFSSSTRTKAITFPKAYSAVPAVFVSQVFDDTNIVVQNFQPTKTGFTASVSGAFSSSGTRTFQWVAIGKQ